ncbi:MAG: IS21-like element ISPsy14 family transposase [Planctomycetota bacterium]
MANRRLSMRKIREVLRLAFFAGLELRKIERSLSISHATVASYLAKAQAAGLSWPLPDHLDDAALERLFFPKPAACAASRPTPDWEYVHGELRKKGVTRILLWQEYKETHPDGYQLTQFYELYNRWSGKIDLVMRQDHRAGEKLFVDYAGPTVPIIDRRTGEVLFDAQIFVAVLGASNYSYAEATRTQTLPDRIGAHVRTFAFLGGVPEIIVPDNLKSGVSKPCRYEPDINPTYHAMAAHYGTVVIPARVGKAKDKAKVESGVLLVERWILAALRNRTFFCLSELNGAIRELLARLNDRPFQKLPGSRRSMFETVDRPALRPLPVTPYVYEEWSYARVGIDYPVEVDGHYYSVPYALVKKKVDIRATATTVEVLFQGNRVASHARSFLKGKHTTRPEHMPSSHRRYAEWTPERILRWAATVGPLTEAHVGAILEHRPHPEQGFRAALGVMRLARQYGTDRLEAACKRASTYRLYSYKGVSNILKSGADRLDASKNAPALPPIVHDNIRGPGYYH